MAAKYTRRLIGGLSLSAGLPFGAFFEAVPAFLHQAGFDVHQIGLFSLLQLPWIGKPLWAPWLDRSRRPGRWLAAAGALTGLAFAGLALCVTAPSVPLLSACLLLLAAGAATQDLVIDATFVARSQATGGTTADLGALSAVRMAAYKAGVFGGGGAVVALGAVWGWQAGFFAAAAWTVLAGGPLGRALVTTSAPAPPSNDAAPTGAATAPATAAPSVAAFGRELRAWLRTPGTAQLVAFLFCYKLTLCCLGPLSKPFWLQHGAGALQLGAVAVGVGLPGALLGSFCAAVALRRWPWSQALQLGSALEALTSLGYLAAHLGLGPRLLPACVLAEGVAQGFTTTLVTALIARCCVPAQAATQFALLGAAFGSARLLGGPLSGLLVPACGWTGFLALIPWLSLVALLLLPALRRRLGETPSGPPP